MAADFRGKRDQQFNLICLNDYLFIQRWSNGTFPIIYDAKWNKTNLCCR